MFPFVKSTFSRFPILFLILGFVLNLSLFDDSEAYPRKVLLEDFTSTTCPPCAQLAPALEQGIEDAGEAVVPIGIHVWWPGDSDPWYQANDPDPRIRVPYYGVRGVPTLKLDGSTLNSRNADGITRAILNRADEESPLRITLDGELDGYNLNATATIEAEEDIMGATFYFAILDDYIQYRGSNGQNEHHDALVKMLPDAEGQRLSIESGTSEEFTFEENMEGWFWHNLEEDNVLMIAWVQNDNSKNVYQAENFFFFSEVALDGIAIADSEEDNGDGRPEPGETGLINFTISNAPSHKSTGEFEIGVSTDDEDIEFVEDMVMIENLAGGESTEVSFEFNVAENAEAHPVRFAISAMSEDGMIDLQEEIEIMIGWPDVLVVDAAGSDNATEAMMEIWGTNDLPWADRFDRNELGIITEEDISNYNVIIWHSFNTEAFIMDEWEEDILGFYLDNGGTLILSSPGYIRERGNSNFIRDYLGAVIDNEDTGENSMSGVAGNENFEDASLFAGGRAGDCAGFPDHTPSLTALDGAQSILVWGNEDEGIGSAGVLHETDDFRTIILAFPIESLANPNGFMSTESRDEFMARLWNWYQSGTWVEDGEPASPFAFSLDAAYPNPFNSQFVVPFTIEQSGNVNMTIHDITGREISSIFSGQLNAGHHQQTVNADQFGLSNGLYIIRLATQNNTAQQKVLFVK